VLPYSFQVLGCYLQIQVVPPLGERRDKSTQIERICSLQADKPKREVHTLNLAFLRLPPDSAIAVVNTREASWAEAERWSLHVENRIDDTVNPTLAMMTRKMSHRLIHILRLDLEFI
jgi:hypothetical protein